MGRTLFIFLLTITHVSLLFNSVIATSSKKGFSIKLIHIDSKESPLYPGDQLTRDERLQRLVELSKAQARYIRSKIMLCNATRSMNPDVARFPVIYGHRMFYVAKVGLGTFLGSQQPFINYYLIVDSGSDDTWVQCEGATEAFNQDMPFYPWSLSSTYYYVPCNTHPRCMGQNCNSDGQCTYVTNYLTRSSSSGIFAAEKFTLGSDIGGFESIELRMGCGFCQENSDHVIGSNHLRGKPYLIAGILGLGPGPWSFINQLGAAGQGKFSYCFDIYNQNIEGSDTYLRFGADATIGGAGQEVHTTPMVAPKSDFSFYYLSLEDISVGNKRVGFPKGIFKRRSEGKGGTVIDSGTLISMMYGHHFDVVADLVRAHFNELVVEYIGSLQNFDACFRIPGRFDITNYPSITLHFQQDDYLISDYIANFIIIRENVCLGIFRMENDLPTFILGVNQQANKRILYNIMDESLSFATEHCELGS
ncbi:aspartic proteinase CDR1-like [Papaver somniferum]|uniref:aspartic proteinase CDR1-like n=1 Tax=Papaver somniferum TaxID=3469 RepID=UPI000E700CB5|nr:aspartic proteinase CDR1-like [Papaver somniferum]